MGFECSSLKLPVIDFSVPDLEPATRNWDSLKSEVRKALEEFGCFEALYNKVSQDQTKETMSALKELFELPLETKMRNFTEKPFYGYIGPNPRYPLLESLGFEDADILDKLDGVTNVFWPEGHPTFSKTLHSYTRPLTELDQIVRRMILESLGLEKYVDEHMNSTNCLVRVMKYKEPESTEAKLGLDSHTDPNTVSILFQNQVDGLQVQTKDGQWIAAELSTPHSFIVMIGKALHAVTNGRLRPPHHRVVMTGYEARYSIGVFSLPKAGYMIKAPEEAIDEQYPLLYRPYDYLEFLDYYLSEAGRNDPSPLRTYCGV